MELENRLKLIRQVGEEIVTEDELKNLLESKKTFVAYDGFEPSGTSVHIGQGLLRAINVNRMTAAGCRFKMLVADWHAWANNKMGGNLDNIQKVGKYLVEVWRACEMDLDNVEFVWANDMVTDREYWKKVMQVARNSTVKRVVRCGQIMGRKESEVLQASQILYPCMQCADIFHLEADVCQLGMDQRKVNVLAREIGPKLGWGKPVIVSHHMLMGLGKPVSSEKDATERAIEHKMSKSKPETAIFMNDTEEEVTRKINNAYCPEGQIHENPILEYCKYIIFEKSKSLKVERPEKWGGDIEFYSYHELQDSFKKKELHPMDLKKAVGIELNNLLEPIRKRLSHNKTAQKLEEEIKTFQITR
ncbi:MAG: tyrosine--tRNA ligase [Candidatus Woesearchaeota archaeon]